VRNPLLARFKKYSPTRVAYRRHVEKKKKSRGRIGKIRGGGTQSGEKKSGLSDVEKKEEPRV